MEALTTLLKRVTKLDSGKLINKATDKTVQKFIIQLNTEGQPTSQLFNLHVDSTGKALFSKTRGTGVYSKETEKLSNGRKKAGDQYNFKDTGEFYESFKLTKGKIAIVISANPLKEDTNLVDEYGPDILGLTDDNLQLLIDELLPKIQSALLVKLQA